MPFIFSKRRRGADLMRLLIGEVQWKGTAGKRKQPLSVWNGHGLVPSEFLRLTRITGFCPVGETKCLQAFTGNRFLERNGRFLRDMDRAIEMFEALTAVGRLGDAKWNVRCPNPDFRRKTRPGWEYMKWKCAFLNWVQNGISKRTRLDCNENTSWIKRTVFILCQVLSFQLWLLILWFMIEIHVDGTKTAGWILIN